MSANGSNLNVSVEDKKCTEKEATDNLQYEVTEDLKANEAEVINREKKIEKDLKEILDGVRKDLSEAEKAIIKCEEGFDKVKRQLDPGCENVLEITKMKTDEDVEMKDIVNDVLNHFTQTKAILAEGEENVNEIKKAFGKLKERIDVITINKIDDFVTVLKETSEFISKSVAKIDAVALKVNEKVKELNETSDKL